MKQLRNLCVLNNLFVLVYCFSRDRKIHNLILDLVCIFLTCDLYILKFAVRVDRNPSLWSARSIFVLWNWDSLGRSPFSPLNLIKTCSLLCNICISQNTTCLNSVSNICISDYMPHYQVGEDDLWEELNGHELMKNVDLDKATYMYTKQRVMDAVGRLLEMRTNLHGFAFHLHLCS